MFRRNKGKIVAVFDIGSASVGTALVEVSSEKIPTIIETHRKDIPFQADIDSYRFYRRMVDTLEAVIGKTRGMKDKKIADEVVCFFASPWFGAECGTAKISKQVEFRITEKIVEDTINEKVRSFEESMKKRYHSDKLGVPVLVEKMNMRTRLNGYEVLNFKDRNTKELEVNFFASLVPEKILSDVKDVFYRHLNDRDIRFRTTPLSSYLVIRDQLSNKKDSVLFLDITGEVTDIMWVREGVIRQEATFPIGKNFLVRKIAERFDISTAEAEKTLTLCQSGKMDEKSKRSVEEEVAKYLQKWICELKDTIRKFSRGGVTPRSVFFVSDEHFCGVYQKVLQKHFFPSSDEEKADTPVSEVQYLGGSIIESLCRFENSKCKDALLALRVASLVHSQK